MTTMGKRSGVLARSVVLLFFCAFCAWAATVVAADDDDRVGSETCEICHDDVVPAFRGNVHWKVDPEGSCENCHGPGTAHVDEGDPAKIRRFAADVPAAERAGACLECHGREIDHRRFASSEHGLAAMDCGSCHSPHRPAAEPLLRSDDPSLCYECHGTIRAEFSLNKRHPVDHGSVDCADCHDPHAPSTKRVLGGFKQRVCLDCHTEYRGPWFFEHEAVTVEGCQACHAPHGSVNRHMLTYQRVSDLCLQCHPAQPYFHQATDASGGRTTSYNDCTRCHSEIHGSNNDALFLN